MSRAWAERWTRSRQGSHAGRGFHYQEAIATHLAILGRIGERTILSLIPEGLEDLSLETRSGWIHAQIKSRRPHQADFPLKDIATFLMKAWNGLPTRGQPDTELVLILERPVAGFPETGWDRTIAEVRELAEALRPLLEELASYFAHAQNDSRAAGKGCAEAR